MGSGSGDAIYRSSDGGYSWSSSSTGLPKFISVSNITVHPINHQIVYAGYNSETGVSRSIDGGRTWTSVAYNDVVAKSGVNNIIIAPSEPSTIYISVNVFFSTNSIYIYRSTNGGDSWTATGNSGLPTNSYLNSMVVDSNNSKILYVYTSGKIYKSTDGGDSWAVLANTGLPANVSISSIAVDPATGDVFTSAYTSTYTNGKSIYTSGIYRFVNGTWVLITNNFIGDYSVSSLFFDMAATGHYYLGIGSEVYRSKDSGTTWDKLAYSGLAGAVNPLAVHPSNTSEIYALTSASGVQSLVEVATPPVITSHSPQSNATGVSIQSPVTITFDKSLLAASVSEASVSVTKLSATKITGSVSVTGATLTFTPSSPLEYGKSYVVNLADGIKDMAGTPTTLPTSWQFTTESAPQKILTINFSGSGNGSVKSTPDHLSCQVGGNCSGLYDLFSSLSLIATPGNSSYFLEWQGACQGTNPSGCTIATMNGDTSVSAKFDLMPIYNSSLSVYFMNLIAALQGSGTLDTIYLLQTTNQAVPPGGLIFNQQKMVTLRGGYDSSFNVRNGLTPIIVGSADPVVINKGSVVFDQVIIK